MPTTRDAVAGAAILRGSANGHDLVSLVAHGEPARERARALSDLDAALPAPEAFAAVGARVEGLATTPDFHPGRPVPVGVALAVRGAILPHVVGSDIGCGMRLLVLRGVRADAVRARLPELARHLRHLLFQGGRDVALTGDQRRALLRDGMPGLVESLRAGNPGLLGRLDLAGAEADLDRTCDLGAFHAGGIHPGFADYAAPGTDFRWDGIAGSVGGGNHFVELGVVDRVFDGAFAHAAGLRAGDVTLCVHSGSLDLGQRVATDVRDALHGERGGGRDPRVLALDAPLARRYRTGLANAGNFAYGNRFLLGLVAADAVRRATGRDPEARLVYDAAHNMAWTDGERVLHRKGACPARDGVAMMGSPYAHLGEPVILPGSMGDTTWLLKGTGSSTTLASSAHGAGRRLSRAEARRLVVVPSELRVVGPVDLDDPALRGREDVLREARGRLNEEAPGAYRRIDDVVEAQERAGIVGRVASYRPLLTVKG